MSYKEVPVLYGSLYIGGGSPFSYIQNSYVGTSTAPTLSGTTAGHTLVYFGTSLNQVTAIGDGSNTWVVFSTNAYYPDYLYGNYTNMGYCLSCVGGTSTLTLTGTGVQYGPSYMSEYSGASALDNFYFGSNAFVTITPAQLGEMGVGAVFTDNNSGTTPPNLWASRASNVYLGSYDVALADNLILNLGTQDVDFGNASVASQAFLTFKPANSSGTITVNTSGGVTKITGWSAGDSSNTTLSTSNSNITINQTQEVIIDCCLTIYNTVGGVLYYTGIYINGTLFNPSFQGQASWANYVTCRNRCHYNATYGDVIDVRIHPANGSDPTNRPTIVSGNFSVIGA